jgi:hypothetical protein
MPWRREDHARPKRPADIEVIRVRKREWPCNGPPTVPAPLYTTSSRQARCYRMRGHHRPPNAQLPAASSTDHGLQHLYGGKCSR